MCYFNLVNNFVSLNCQLLKCFSYELTLVNNLVDIRIHRPIVMCWYFQGRIRIAVGIIGIGRNTSWCFRRRLSLQISGSQETNDAGAPFFKAGEYVGICRYWIVLIELLNSCKIAPNFGHVVLCKQNGTKQNSEVSLEMGRFYFFSFYVIYVE